MSSGLEIIQLGSSIKAHYDRGDHAQDKAEQHYKAAGIYLIEAQQRIKAGEYGKPFSHYCSSVLRLGSSRCYELIAIASGSKTLEEIRDRHVDYRARKKEESTVRSQAETKQRTEPQQQNPETTKTPLAKPTKPVGRPAVDRISNLQSKIRAELKRMDAAQLETVLKLLKGV